eukprot:scaffold42482_cov52-Attheya_sp.AAC.2
MVCGVVMFGGHKILLGILALSVSVDETDVRKIARTSSGTKILGIQKPRESRVQSWSLDQLSFNSYYKKCGSLVWVRPQMWYFEEGEVLRDAGYLEEGSTFSRNSFLGRVLIWGGNILLTDGSVPLAYNIVPYGKRLSASIYPILDGPLCSWRHIRLI